jgi:WD domain, G-beta repeat
VASIAFSPEGRLLASGSWTGHVRVRDWPTAREVADFEVPGVARLAFSPDGELLATATERKTAQLWNVNQRKLHADLEGDLFRFHCVMFSPDGKLVLAGGGDWKRGGTNQVTIWDVATKKQVGKLLHDNAVICMTYSPDHKLIATGSIDMTIRLWDADSFKELKTLRGHQHWVETLVFTADSKTLVSGSHDYSVRFWDVAEGKETDRVEFPGKSVRVVQFTPDGFGLIVGGGKKMLTIFDATGRKEQMALWDGTNPQKTAMDELPVGRALPGQFAAQEGVVEAPQPWRWRLWLAAAIALVMATALLLGLLSQLRRRRYAQPLLPNDQSNPIPSSPKPAESPPATISFSCSNCGKGLKAKAQSAGKNVTCPHCGQATHVPESSAGESASRAK